jgi:predicted alpha/beta hydrolase family esterase
MKKVFIVHGLEGSPNGGWRPWLMAELQKLDVYACALSMPNSSNPIYSEWSEEIDRHIIRNKQDELYLVGHSLGVPAILQYLEEANVHLSGIVLISGPAQTIASTKIYGFLEKPLNFETIITKVDHISVIHGIDDLVVPFKDAEFLTQNFKCNLVPVPNGKHLNGSAGWYQLPECLEELKKMF